MVINSFQTLEEFVSRDINYLITSQSRPKVRPVDPYADFSPTPSPFNCEPSPSPSNPEERKVTLVNIAFFRLCLKQLKEQTQEE